MFPNISILYEYKYKYHFYKDIHLIMKVFQCVYAKIPFLFKVYLCHPVFLQLNKTLSSNNCNST